MGIQTETFGFLHQSMFATMPDLKFAGKYMVELGDQKLNAHVALKPSGERVWAKDYFELLGFHHYCIDLHGMNGSFPLDLSRPIEDKFWINKFDVLTNFGTSEHVLNQCERWRNIHNLVKVGGSFIHVIPQIGSLVGHCPYYYSNQFFRSLAMVNNYDIIFNNYLPTVGCIAICLIKQKDNLFIWNNVGLVKMALTMNKETQSESSIGL